MHPVDIDALLESLPASGEYVAHAGTPVWVASRVGRRLLVSRAAMHDLWPRCHWGEPLVLQRRWPNHEVTGAWDDHAGPGWLTTDTPPTARTP
jgi:hypothetical protein